MAGLIPATDAYERTTAKLLSFRPIPQDTLDYVNKCIEEAIEKGNHFTSVFITKYEYVEPLRYLLQLNGYSVNVVSSEKVSIQWQKY